MSYADDTVILFQADSWNEVYQTAENELKTVQKWINSMRLSINTTKTKFLTFSLNKQDQPARSSLTIHNETCLSTRNCKCDARVEKVTSTKYLGLVLDENLKWKLHIEHIVKRLSGMMYKFYELRNILAYNNLKIVYYALAESFIRYCILIWGGLYQDPLKQLNVIQNSILKILFKKERRYSTQSLYTELKIMNIRQLYSYRCLLWVFDNKQVNTSPGSAHHTRFCMHIDVPFFRKTHFQRFVFFHGPKLYNSLPPEIKDISNKAQYRREITSFILSNYNMINDFFKIRY